MSEIRVTINGRATPVPEGITVLQACELAGFGDDVPRFCYHKRLGVAGNCRRCLVEIDKNIKPQASCAMPVRPNMAVFTNSPQVKKARESVREFLLRNHPLDCPICDQGGECDLQDQAMHYGSDRSRYEFVKRSVEDKDWGPLVKTVRTRCIQCTRCVRFASEVAGVSAVGATGRGNQVEIGMYTEKPFLSEISGNVVDLCPVGALTAGASGVPFSFRPWELRSVDGIDVTDSSLTPLRYQFRGGALRRILPREGGNSDGIGSKGEWITDKGRYSPLDGAMVQRVLKASVKVAQPDGSTQWASSDTVVIKELLGTVVPSKDLGAPVLTLLKGSEGASVRIVHGGNIDCRSLAALVEWAKAQAGNCRVETVAAVTGDNPVGNKVSDAPSIANSISDNNLPLAASAALKTRLDSNKEIGLASLGHGLASLGQVPGVLVIGYNPRLQNTLLNVRLREHFLAGGVVIGVGGSIDLTYQVMHAGFKLHSSKVFNQSLDSVLVEVEVEVEQSVKVVDTIIGSDLSRRIDFNEVLLTATPKKDSKGTWNYGFTRSNEAYVSSEAEVNKFTVSKSHKYNVQFIVGITESEVDAAGYTIDQVLSSARFNVVLSSQGAEWMKKADVIIAVRNDIEVKGLFKSIDGSYQAQAVTSMAVAGKEVPTIEEVFEHVVPSTKVSSVVVVPKVKAGPENKQGDHPVFNFVKFTDKPSVNVERSNLPYTVSLVDYHLEGHPFAEASAIMARCSAVFAENQTNFTLTTTCGGWPLFLVVVAVVISGS